MTIEAIAVDIDGTITDEKRQICISAIEALRKALEQEKNKQVELKDERLQKAQADAKNVLLSAKTEATHIIRELNILYNNSGS